MSVMCEFLGGPMDGTKDFEMSDEQMLVEIRSYEGAVDLDSDGDVVVGQYRRNELQPTKLIWIGWE